jgi:hypothetical protein
MGMGPRTSMAIRVEEEAARFGFVKVRGMADNHRKIGWKIHCAKCPAEFLTYWPIEVPPESMVKAMRVRQWDVGRGERPLCPTCAHAPHKGPLAKPEAQSFTPFVEPMPDTVVYHQLLNAAEKTARRAVLSHKLDEATTHLVKASSDLERTREQTEQLRKIEKQARRDERNQRKDARRAARLAQEAEAFAALAQKIESHSDEGNAMNNPSMKITHTVFQLLDSVFDVNKRLYRAGYNDARVARDAGTTEEMVSKLRVEVYGELSEDPRIQAIKDDIELLNMQLTETAKANERMVRDLQSRLEQLRVNLPK